MAVITLIDGVPLFTTIQEALDWADSRGLNNYHTHTHQGVVGYMGGIDHGQAFLSSTSINTVNSAAGGGGGGGTTSRGGGGY